MAHIEVVFKREGTREEQIIQKDLGELVLVKLRGEACEHHGVFARAKVKIDKDGCIITDVCCDKFADAIQKKVESLMK